MFSIAGDATLSSINLSRVGGEDSDYTLVTLKLAVETRSDAAICAALGVESGDALEWAWQYPEDSDDIDACERRYPYMGAIASGLRIGIPQVYASQKRPTWPDAGSSPAMAVAINVRPLYTAPPPAPIAEMREPSPEECKRICTEYERLLMREGTCGGRDAFDAVRAVMWPKEGL